MRVLLADDHTLVRAGIRRLVESIDGAEVVAEAKDGRETLALVDQHRPDVALVDLAMPGGSGFDLIAELHERFPQTAIVVMSMHADLGYVRTALERGASGFVVKDAAPDELEQALRAARAGEAFLSRQISAQMLGTFLGRSKPSGLAALTPRQREVLQLLAQGRSTKEIAGELGVSIKTVETHRARMMELLDLKKAADLVRFAVRHNLDV
jgi:DNA-binding NarL/FixJ family response regulator